MYESMGADARMKHKKSYNFNKHITTISSVLGSYKCYCQFLSTRFTNELALGKYMTVKYESMGEGYQWTTERMKVEASN